MPPKLAAEDTDKPPLDEAKRRRSRDGAERRQRWRESSPTGRRRRKGRDRGPAREARREGDVDDGGDDVGDVDRRLMVVLSQCAPLKARSDYCKPECATFRTSLLALALAAHPAHCHHGAPNMTT